MLSRVAFIGHDELRDAVARDSLAYDVDGNTKV